MISISKRSAVEPFHAMDILAEATRRRQEGRPVISMAVGQPGHPAPQAALAAARSALDVGRIGYTDALGLTELRKALAVEYGRRHAVALDWNRVVVTTGSSAGFNLAFLALFDAGDAVAIARPGYPAYRSILAALGLRVIEVPVGPETGYTLTPESLERAQAEAGMRLKGVLLASPANPTGTVTTGKQLKSVYDYCKGEGITLISDEIYHGLTYGAEEVTALEIGDEAVIINSFSKYYCMTGWRIGWMVVPAELVRPIECLAQSLYISAPELSQIAALAALSATDELEHYKAACSANRDFLMQRLPELGLPLLSPMDGAFYAYVNASRYTNDSMQLAKRILAETDVAVTPGRDFDPVDGHLALRLSYAGSMQDMVEAASRLKAWLPGAV